MESYLMTEKPTLVERSGRYETTTTGEPHPQFRKVILLQFRTIGGYEYHRREQPENSSEPCPNVLVLSWIEQKLPSCTFDHMRNPDPIHRNNEDPFGRLSLGSRPPECKRLVQDFCIYIPTATSATIILPPRCSRLQLLERAQHAVHAVYDADLVDSELLDEWRHDPAFNESYDRAALITVEIQRDHNLKKKREDHAIHLAAKGREIATKEDTAAAWAAFFVQTGMDLFGGEGVQTAHRGLQLNDEGLVEIEFHKTVAVAVAGLVGSSTRHIRHN